VFVPNLLGGDYEVSAFLTDAAGQRLAVARKSARVLSLVGEE
jgi:hypothetical protein